MTNTQDDGERIDDTTNDGELASEDNLTEDEIIGEIDDLLEDDEDEAKAEARENSKAGQLASAAAAIAKGEKSLDEYPEWIQEELAAKVAPDKKLLERIEKLESEINEQKSYKEKKEFAKFKSEVAEAAKKVVRTKQEDFIKKCGEIRKKYKVLTAQEVINRAAGALDIEFTPERKGSEPLKTKSVKPANWSKATADQIRAIDTPEEWEAAKKQMSGG